MHETHEQATVNAHLAAVALSSAADGDLTSPWFVEAERSLLGLPPAWSAEPGARQLSWVGKLHTYEEFTRQHGRAPRENTRNREALPAEERRMGEWARYQRRRGEHLCSFQKARLEMSPAFQWDPQEAAWDAQFNACVKHATRCGRLPILNSADPVEFASARWLGRQLRQLKLGTLRLGRAERIRELLNTFAAR